MRRLGLCLLVLVCAAPSGHADVITRTDQRDKGRFDLRQASGGHDLPADDGAPRLRHEVRTNGAWSRKDIRCQFNGCLTWSLKIQFDTKGGPDYERVLHIFSQRGRGMEAEMFRHTQTNEQCEWPRVACGRQGYLGRVGVWRTDHSTVVVRFKRRLLGWHLNSYGWRAISVYDEPQGGCTKDDKGGSPNGSYEVASSLGPPFCVDYVPGRKRYVRHRGL